MTDGSFIQNMALKAGLTNEEAERLVAGFAQTIQNGLKVDKRVEIEGFGIFELKDYELNFIADKELLG